MNKTGIVLVISGLLAVSSYAAGAGQAEQAAKNAVQAQRAFVASMDYVHGWLGHRDPQSGLIPRNLTESHFWNAKDSAADNYPFMVLACALLNRDLFEGTMREMLEKETRLTSRLDRLPDDFDFAKQDFRAPEAKLEDMIFGGSEYMKDGLMPLTEWLGNSPWYERMIGIMDSVWKHAPVDTPYGKIPSLIDEVAGDNMQVLVRLYFMTGDNKYKEWAFRYGDYYLLDHLPTDTDRLQLDDHGCEIVDGLTAVYLMAYKCDTKRYFRYKEPIYRMLNRILDVGVNEDGLVYSVINPKEGIVLKDELSDNWGYNYNGILNVATIDGEPRFQKATEHLLGSIYKYLDYPWEGRGADGYADAIEGGINLLNRIPVQSGWTWVDQSMELLLAKQRPDGIIEGWHGDGNFTRTCLMYALWKTQGVTIEPWRADIQFGAEREGNTLYISIKSDWPWRGQVKLDIPRHRESMNLPYDYPRINQFPEWYTVERNHMYTVYKGELPKIELSGIELRQGIELSLKRNESIVVKIVGEE